MNVAAFVFPSRNEKCVLPWAETAESMFTGSRLPVPATTGVRPTGAQVVPEWWSVRTPASSATKMAAPATAEQLADSLPGVAHPELPFDHLTHQIAGPQGEIQLELPRILPHNGSA